MSDEIETAQLIPFLKERRGFLDAVVFSGGEPTINPELPQVIRQVKETGYLVKLDTNGTRPKAVKRIIDAGLSSFCFVAGMVISFALSTPTGPSVVAVNIICFCVFAALGRAHALKMTARRANIR